MGQFDPKLGVMEGYCRGKGNQVELRAGCPCALVPDYSVGFLNSPDIDCCQGELEAENRKRLDMPSPDYP